MNIYQRIILILGAIALVVAIWTTPQVIYTREYGYISFDKEIHGLLYPQRHFNTVVARSIGVMGATILVFFTLKGIENKEKQKRR